MDLGWTRYQELEERTNIWKCIDHRFKNGLSIIDVEEIDCETSCEANATCPFNKVM